MKGNVISTSCVTGVISKALYSHPDLEVSNHIKSTFVGVLLMCSINIIINIS